MELERIVLMYRGPLVGLFASWGASWADAVELSGDCFSEAYVSRERYNASWDDDVRLGRWLRGIARNLWRQKKRESTRHAGVPLELDELAGPEDPGPEALRWRLDALREEMAGLREAYRRVIYMHYFERTSHREVAVLMGVSERAVEGLLYKARAELRRRFAKRDFELEVKA